MTKGKEIANAIGEHGQWKEHLEEAIKTGKSDLTVEIARHDNACDFGKWLLGLPEKEKTTERWKKIKSLHQAFHAEATIVLKLALKGDKKGALEAIHSECPFIRCSEDLISAMMVWLDEV